MISWFWIGLLCYPVATWASPKISLDSTLWKLESQSHGISLSTCTVLGTGIVPVKSVMTIPASVEEVSAVLEDAPRRGQWIARFGSSALLERLNDYNQTEYLRMSMPWPFVDRTAIVRVRIGVSEDQSVATVEATSVANYPAPGLPMLLRSEVFESTFQMRRSPEGTRVTALVFVDPKGNLPAWVVNLFTSRVSRQTLEGLRRQVARKLYSPAALEALHHRILHYHEFKQTYCIKDPACL